jgi:hypothetical protein
MCGTASLSNQRLFGLTDFNHCIEIRLAKESYEQDHARRQMNMAHTGAIMMSFLQIDSLDCRDFLDPGVDPSHGKKTNSILVTMRKLKQVYQQGSLCHWRFESEGLTKRN